MKNENNKKALERLIYEQNSLAEQNVLDVSNNARLESLNVSKNPALTDLNCDKNVKVQKEQETEAAKTKTETEVAKLEAETAKAEAAPETEMEPSAEESLLENPDVQENINFLEENGENGYADALRDACADIDHMQDIIINCRPDDMEAVQKAISELIKNIAEVGMIPRNIVLNLVNTAEREKTRYQQMSEAVRDAKDYVKGQSHEMAEAVHSHGRNALDTVKAGVSGIVKCAGRVEKKIGDFLKISLYEVEKAGAKIARAAGEWREYSQTDKKADLDSGAAKMAEKRDSWQNRHNAGRNLINDFKTLFTGKVGNVTPSTAYGFIAGIFNDRHIKLTNASADVQKTINRAQEYQKRMDDFIQGRNDRINSIKNPAQDGTGDDENDNGQEAPEAEVQEAEEPQEQDSYDRDDM